MKPTIPPMNPAKGIQAIKTPMTRRSSPVRVLFILFVRATSQEFAGYWYG
jgi:hypothetical protein